MLMQYTFPVGLVGFQEFLDLFHGGGFPAIEVDFVFLLFLWSLHVSNKNYKTLRVLSNLFNLNFNMDALQKKTPTNTQIHPLATLDNSEVR